jgi:hypothetical protein
MLQVRNPGESFLARLVRGNFDRPREGKEGGGVLRLQKKASFLNGGLVLLIRNLMNSPRLGRYLGRKRLGKTRWNLKIIKKGQKWQRKGQLFFG